ncbi:hypothetical protein CKF54_02625 [Psittacicella hinzii]|uniref:Uncharacterized protein n=1 Tax=Psittacicella hinzii TaxID=2028575 RepID=A0A3A1Y5H4_9GAMM|nr:hypothetical protein [Psittacicella hinzii]RIY33522.1 hypothetical protein CKF54_02625 [Psittacicella hinzii]
MTRIPQEQIFSAFIFDPNNPRRNLVSLNNTLPDGIFDRNSIIEVMTKQEGAIPEEYTYEVYDTPECLLLRNGLLVKVYKHEFVKLYQVKVYKFNYANVFQEPVLVEELTFPLEQKLELGKALYFDHYGLPFLTKLLAPNFPLIASNDKILQIKPLLRFSAKIYDNTPFISEGSIDPFSQPLELRDYSFELVGEQDLFSSLCNNNGCTLFELHDPSLVNGLPALSDYVVPLENKVEPEKVTPASWRLSYTEHVLSYEIEEESEEEAGEKDFPIMIYDSPFVRPKKLNYYLTKFHNRKNCFYQNFTQALSSNWSHETFKFVPDQEHIHLLNYLHLFNPLKNFEAKVIQRELDYYTKDITIYDIRDKILKAQEYWFVLYLCSNFAPNDYTKEMLEEYSLLLKNIESYIRRLSVKPDGEFLERAMGACAEIRQEIAYLEKYPVNDQDVGRISIRHLEAGVSFVRALVALRTLYLARFGTNTEILYD